MLNDDSSAQPSVERRFKHLDNLLDAFLGDLGNGNKLPMNMLLVISARRVVGGAVYVFYRLIVLCFFQYQPERLHFFQKLSVKFEKPLAIVVDDNYIK